ncbi:uncharacterized protein TRIADDRAFT_54712 [Trichoplax adhaerens]|uniref:UME domain-containing protein n=1 Tax=Trichoplax adhaerens TaxID=10228 RepID=B3RSS5_TRIAD|nr:predicted protein [Trichoplax adhaerens]EDV26575.1 predicted protein [Trichoplax adhaerens]|eukprot:XP_002110571.1 predicted protein [Trichoplax adhaerens]
MSGRPSSSGTQSKLKQIVIDFANRVQNVEPDQRILETRNLLCHLVSRYLLNIEEVSTQLAKKTGISSQPETLLSFMQHLVSDQPECFVPETFEAIDVTSKAFIKWITCKLMHLLASSDCQKLHSTSSQIIISILKLIELKDLIFFREIIEEFVMILMSLSNTEFTGLDLQNAIEINCFVLEDSELNSVTVRLCSALIDNNIIPKPTLCEYFINCVLALLNFALYSHANSISSGLELSIDSCFNVLLPYNTSAGIVQATPLMEEFKISREYIEQILTGVVTLLNLHPNFCIRDQKSLAVPVCHALYSIGCYEALQRRKNNQTCLIGFTSEVLNWLISQIGSDCNQQPLLGPLSQWSWLEISYQDNLNKLPQTISHGLDAEDDVTDNLNYDSVAFAMMSKRYFDLCSLLSKSFEGLDVLEIVQTMEGIRICIETFARCNIMVLSLSPSTRNTSSISYGCAKGSQYMSQNLNSDNVLQGSSEIVNPESGINLSLYAIKNSWFNSDQLSLLYTTWKNILLRLKSIVEDELELVVNLEAVYKIIINSAGAILNLCYPSEVLTLSDDLLYYLTNLVSLPWIHEINQDCIDMIIDNDIKSISTAIAKYLDDSKCGSIHNLALLPYGVAPSFRMEVFKKCLLPSNNESLRIAAVKSVPQFLTNLGVQYYHEIISYLSNILDTDSCSIKETVASCIGSIACALSQSPKLQWSSNISFDSTIADGATLHCSYCQKLIEDSYSSAERGSDIAALNSDSYSLAKSIMGLVDDPDHEVRLIFSYLVRFLLYETSPPTEDLLGSIQNNFAATPVNSLNGYVVSKIKSVLSKALKESNHRIAEGELLLVVVIALLEGLLSTYGAVVAVTFDQIRLVAKSKALSPEKLFNRFKEKLCEVLVDNIHDNSLEAKQAIETSIGEVVRVFAFKDIGTFLKDYYLMYVDNFPYVATFLITNCNSEIQEKAFHFVEEESTVDLFGLLKSSSQKLLGQLLLYLGSHFTEVFNGLLMLAGWDETFKCEFADPEKAVADYLQPKLLGILTFFNSSLLRAADAEEKKRAIIVLFILRASLQLREEKLLRLACRAWNSFVKSVELSSLGPMLSQIIAILYPVMKKYAEFVSPVLDYLIVDNRSQLKEYFREIPFIPDVPQLLKANNVLKEELERANSGEIGPKEKLSQIMKGVCHESADVRLHALSNLRRVLYDLQSQIHEYVLSSEKTDPIVTEIVNELLRRCRLASSKERNLCGECLGIIGAIDPGRLEKVSELSSFGRKFLEFWTTSLENVSGKCSGNFTATLTL